MKIYMLSVPMYDSEIWNIGKRNKRTIEASEVFSGMYWRRLLRITWKDKGRNVDVLKV